MNRDIDKEFQELIVEATSQYTGKFPDGKIWNKVEFLCKKFCMTDDNMGFITLILFEDRIDIRMNIKPDGLFDEGILITVKEDSTYTSFFSVYVGN